jgi:hypothetical protein
MRIFFKLLFVLVAVGSIWGGIEKWQGLRAMQMSLADFDQVEGRVVSVRQYNDSGPGLGERAGPARTIYNVTYEFSDGHGLRQSHQMTPTCDDCDADAVRRMTGTSPSQLKSGSPVRVLVSKTQPEQAYLALTSEAEIRSQRWGIFFRLLVVPIIAVFGYRMDWTKGNKDERQLEPNV